jgi:hypothetical protein
MKLRSTKPKLKLRYRDAAITLLNAMQDPKLFEPWFKEQSTWRAWRTVIRALFGLPIADLKLYQKLTGRTVAPSKQAREAWIVAGRRAGKSFVGALIGVYLSAFREYGRYLSPGEVCTVMIIAADKKQARTIMRYARALCEEVPLLSRMVEHVGMESITLNNRVVLEIHAASWRSTRGYTLGAILADEVCFWRTDDGSANPDTEILNALRPSMATIPNSLLLCLSSPYARRGALWEAYEQHFGVDGDPTLVFQADTLTLNPSVPQEVVDAAYRDDPVAAASEYGGLFRSDIQTFLQPEWISNAVAEGIHEIGPVPGKVYVGFTDPSGGSSDAFTLAIAHQEGKRLILDVARRHRPPFSLKSVVSEFSLTLKAYGLGRVTGDRYAGDWPATEFREQGIHYEASERVKSDIYLEALPLFSTGAVQLLDNRQLLNELRQLERRTGAGRDRVDHPPRSTDDLANVACGALLLSVRGSLPDFSADRLTTTSTERRTERDDVLAELGLADSGDSAASWDDSPFDLFK